MTLMTLFHHGSTPSAEFPWMLYCPDVPVLFFQSYEKAVSAADALVNDNASCIREFIVIAYAFGTAIADGFNIRMVSNRSKVMLELLQERDRQVLLGRDPAKDPLLEDGSATHAAGAYLTAASAWSMPKELRQIAFDSAKEWWPWAQEEWKPAADALSNLHKAMALLLAEGERLERHRRIWRAVSSCRKPSQAPNVCHSLEK